MKTIHSILVVFLICIFAAALYCHAGEVKHKIMAEGLIEDVTSDFITIHSKSYSISGAHFKDFTGKEVSKDRLKKGIYANIIIEGDGITTVLIDITE